MDTEECTECKQIYDFEKCQSGGCLTCQKKNLCYGCCFSHKCLPNKKPMLYIISNPQWIYRLIKNYNVVNE